MVKSAVIFAVFSLLFSQFVHAAVLDAADTHQNPQNIDLSDAHYHSHSHIDDDHDDDHGLGSLHNALHDMQNIALSMGLVLLAPNMFNAKQSIHGPDIYKGLSLSPPVPPPLT